MAYQGSLGLDPQKIKRENEVFAPVPAPLPSLPSLPEYQVPYIFQPYAPDGADPFYFFMPEDEGASDPAKMEELNSTLKDLEE